MERFLEGLVSDFCNGFKICLVIKCTVETGQYSENSWRELGPLREAIAFEFRSFRLHTKSTRTKTEMDAIFVLAFLWVRCGRLRGRGQNLCSRALLCAFKIQKLL
jgi:hypothetical protein